MQKKQNVDTGTRYNKISNIYTCSNRSLVQKMKVNMVPDIPYSDLGSQGDHLYFSKYQRSLQIVMYTGIGGILII